MMALSNQMMLMFVLLGAAQIEQGLTAPHFDMVRLEQLPSVPHHWQFLYKASPSTNTQLRIALHQQNVVDFEKAVIDLSTPGHPTYRKHMKQQEVKALLRPMDATINGVLGWLESEGVADVLHDSDWMTFNLTVETAERMLNAKFAWYRSEVDGKSNETADLGILSAEEIATAYWLDLSDHAFWSGSS